MAFVILEEGRGTAARCVVWIREFEVGEGGQEGMMVKWEEGGECSRDDDDVVV